MTRRLRIELDIPEWLSDDPDFSARTVLSHDWYDAHNGTAEWVKSFDELRQEFRDRYDSLYAPGIKVLRRGLGQTPNDFEEPNP